jgi:hypothetical protein
MLRSINTNAIIIEINNLFLPKKKKMKNNRDIKEMMKNAFEPANSPAAIARSIEGKKSNPTQNFLLEKN